MSAGTRLSMAWTVSTLGNLEALFNSGSAGAASGSCDCKCFSNPVDVKKLLWHWGQTKMVCFGLVMASSTGAVPTDGAAGGAGLSAIT